MAVRRWDPFRDLLSVQSEMERLFSPARSRPAAGPTPEPKPEPRASWAPALDVYETDRAYIITAELAGMSGDEVDVTVDGNVLTLRGTRPFYAGEAEESFHRVERRFGPFHRRVTLPQTADTSAIEATMADGVLTIEVAKALEPQPQRVEVKARA